MSRSTTTWTSSQRARGGIKTRGHGWDPTAVRLPLVRTSTRVAAHAYPFLSQPGLTDEGTYIGTNLVSGAAFCLDPFVLYRLGFITNPNITVAADVGGGKTNTVAAISLRALQFGYRCAVVDAKPDWGRFAANYGGQTVRLGPSSPVVLNPLDITPYLAYNGPKVDPITGESIDPMVTATTQQHALVRALVETVLSRPLRADNFEGSALGAALHEANERHGNRPILSDVLAALADPQRTVWADLNVTKAEYLHATQGVRGALHELVDGLTGRMFNGQSTITFSRDARVVALDLSELFHDPVNLPRAYTCGAGWLESALFSGTDRWFNIYDEAGAIFQKAPAVIPRLQTSIRLSRLYGICNIIVLHNFSDASAAGDDASAAAKQARQLVSLTGTQIVGRTAEQELDLTTTTLALSDTERAIIATAEQGEFLFRISANQGRLTYRVKCVLHPLEKAMWDTTAQMVGATASGRP